MPPRDDAPATLAAVDLGSNSFRMVVAGVAGEGFQRLDSQREGVRLAAALGPDGRLSAEGEARALACLGRFGERLRDLPSRCVRAVGTNTLRRARGVRSFLDRAEQALGHPVQVISGREEARLIYQGVAHDLGPNRDGRRLVVDVGGGSTECIVGRGLVAERLESLYIGCVGMTLQHFPGGRIRREAMRQAELQAGIELEALAGELRHLPWQECVGSSGTVRSIAAVLVRNGWSADGIDRPGLEKLRKALLDAGDVDSLRLPGLSRERAAVFPGGVAIVSAVFAAFGVERMQPSDGSLREGVLLDLRARLEGDDLRPRTVQRLQEQFRADPEQAARVQTTAAALLDAAAAGWGEPPAEAGDWLAWAARVHEIGLAVAHGGSHKHAAYLLTYAELPGFSLQEQRLLALLVRGHRRKLPPGLCDELPARQRRWAMRLCLLLRLAVLLNRPRSASAVPRLGFHAGDGELWLRFPHGWLEEHPLTAADLEQEAAWLAPAGWKLRWE